MQTYIFDPQNEYFVRPSESITEEQAKQINNERYTQARHTYEIMKKSGYFPTLEGYLKRDGMFVSTHDAYYKDQDAQI